MEKEREKRLIPLPALPQDFLMLTCLAAAAVLTAVGLLAPLQNWLRILFFAVSVLLSGYDLALEAASKLVREQELEANLLLVVAAIGAFLIGRAAEGAAVMVLFKAGVYGLQKLVERSTDAIERLLDRRSDSVNAVIGGAIAQRPAGKIKAGDIISVAPGERLVLDGEVVSGRSELDSSALTGSTERVPVGYGSSVTSGSVNLTGVLNVRVTAEFDGSMMTRLMKLLERSEAKKSGQEKRIERFAHILTPSVIGAALIVGLLVPLIGRLPFPPWFGRGLGFLVVAYPTALLLSAPLTYFAGICGILRKGVLVKDAAVLDTLTHATSIVFDKTGIVTTGEFQVTGVNSREIPPERLLMLAAYAEAESKHPMARAIVEAYGLEPDLSRIAGYREIPGKGTEININGVMVAAGSALLMEELGAIRDIPRNEASVVYIAVSGRYAGRILLKDALKPDAKKAVKDLREAGVDRIALFTGDRKEAAVDAADRLGIQEVYADCLPDEKVKRLKGLTDMQLPGDKLVFVGDGESDRLALQTADIGVSLGGLGSDEAVAAADMIVMTNELSRIAPAIVLARATNGIVRQNIILALALKGLLLLLILIGLVGPWIAVFADAAASVLTIFNARRAFGMRGREIKKELEASRTLPEQDMTADNTEETPADDK